MGVSPDFSKDMFEIPELEMNRARWRCALSLVLLSSAGCSNDEQPAFSQGIGSAGETSVDTGAELDDGSGATDSQDSSEQPTDDTGDTDDTDDTDDSSESPGDGDGDDGNSGPKFDLAGVPDGGHFACGGSTGDPEFSYLWAANSTQGTISKIDTKTVTEVGRFITRPDLNGSPSRTSVSLSGDVAVANRNGGVTKIYANPENCKESNGMPGIQTSTDSQYLQWDQEECRAWYTPMNYPSQRPVAWAPGKWNANTCRWDDEELWTAGTFYNGVIDIILLDGDDGTIKDMVQVPAGNGANQLNNDSFGIYGGASDGDGNFWGSQLGSGKLLRVNREDMSYDIFNAGPSGGWYGMTVDSDGMVWLCSSQVGRFDPLTETWVQAQVGGSAGCMADAGEGGLLWVSNGGGVTGVDRETLQVAKVCNGPGSYGVSVDFEGYVWAVAYGSTATKFDPETCQTWSYNGLVGAYTYSDMTGFALSNAGSPSG